MLNRLTIAIFLALLVGLIGVGSASAAPDRAPIPPPTDYWQDQGFILMAHQGGEWDFPPNTMYAYKKALELGADMLDMDAYVTKDGKIVLTHDIDIYKNTESPQVDGLKINDLTLNQLKDYDFAYKWSPHDGSTTNPFREVATGVVPPPTGFTANDFKIPSFAEVLAAFPDTPINIELKAVPGVDEQDTANEMASILAAHPGHDENVIINSFGQSMLEKMHAARPQHKSFGGSLDGTLDYLGGAPIEPTPVALEPPDLYNLGGALVRTVPILKPNADYDGYKIFVWGSDKDAEQDTDPFYAKLIAEGADSYNTPSPTTLAKYLCENGIAAPDGSPRCDQQICPEGQTGIAPNDCVDIPKAELKLLSFSTPKKLRTGKKTKLSVRIKNTGDAPLKDIKICLKLNNKIKGKIRMSPCSRIKSLGAKKIGHRDLSARYTAKKGKTGSAKSQAAVSKARQGKTGMAKMSLRVTTANGGSVTKTKQLLYTAKAGKSGSASAE